MDAVTAMATTFLSSCSSSSSNSDTILFFLPNRLLHLLRRVLFFLSHVLLSFLFHLFSSPPPPPPTYSSPTNSTSVSRGLSHVLSVAARVPVASRKYGLVRSLADSLLDGNIGSHLNDLNRAALADAFSCTLCRLDAKSSCRDKSMEIVLGAVKSGIKKWWPVTTTTTEKDHENSFGGATAEKLAAELLWLAQKMAECGAVSEATIRWGEAERLGRRALSAEPRLQVALVRVAVFLFKHANSKQFEECTGGEEEDGANAHQRTSMLKSWLPLLCRASNGTDAPVLSSRERAEMVMVLEELIEKLSWEQQEEVLALWLHHFAACPDSDWPNLESCYTHWYSESRKLLTY